MIFVTDPSKEHLMALNSIYDVGLGATFKRLNALKFPNAESRIRKSVSFTFIHTYITTFSGIPGPFGQVKNPYYSIWAIILYGSYIDEIDRLKVRGSLIKRHNFELYLFMSVYWDKSMKYRLRPPLAGP